MEMAEEELIDRTHSDGQWDFPEEEARIDFVATFRELREAKSTILKITAATLAVAVTVSFYLPARYTSVGSFIPPNLNTSNPIASAIAGQLSSLGGGDLVGGMKSSGDMYAGILRSRSISEKLIKQFDLLRVYRVKKESQAEKILESFTSVTSNSKSSIVTLSVTASSPGLAHDLTASYMDALRETNGRLALGQASQRRLFFEQQLAKEKNDLADAEVELKKTEEQSGLIAPVGQTEAQIRTVAETQAQIAARQVQLAALRQSATEQNADVIRLKSEIADLQNQMAQLQRGNGGGVSIPTARVPAVQLEYVRKLREVKYHEALFEAIAKQYEAARLEESREAPVLQVLDPASYPDTRSSPNRFLIALGGLLLGFILGSVWVLTRHRIPRVAAS
jgi:capsule polysaccharide export protein KpsE/RkpR